METQRGERTSFFNARIHGIRKIRSRRKGKRDGEREMEGGGGESCLQTIKGLSTETGHYLTHFDVKATNRSVLKQRRFQNSTS